MYSVDYTKGLSGALNRETLTNHSVYILINHILINLVFLKILESNTENNIATYIKSVSDGFHTFKTSARRFFKIINFRVLDLIRKMIKKILF